MKKMLKNTTMILAAASLLCSCNEKASQQAVKVEKPLIASQSDSLDGRIPVPVDFGEIELSEDGILDRMAYARTDNFMQMKIYPCSRCLLRDEVATALLKAKEMARQKGYQLVIYDCYRPKKYQRIMFDIVKNPKYVADTIKGSNHNKGCAVDLSLASNGSELDMGTKFDDFTEASHPDSENISPQAKKNRAILQSIMTGSGFEIYPYEWWHFNYRNCNYPVAGFLWTCK
jgi:D-alanyl-D-alanine dipeptidase